jgi:metallophosphoesterase (TIGR03768 family)
MLGLAFLICLLIFSSAGCSNSVDVNQSGLQGYPIASDVFTTLQRTVVPDPVPFSAEKIFPYEVPKYKQNGYGNWHYGPGLPYVKRLDLMSPNYNGTSDNNTTELLHFFTMSDIHITDKETPAQAIFFGYKGGTSSAYSPVMLYTTQVLDAAVQTINALHKERPFDFGISLGDDINDDQYNELRWFMDVLDGRNINPDSGAKDDPIPGPYNDYQDEYRAAGLNKSINWYAVLGNHDHLWMGTNPPDDHIKQAYIGEDILNMGNIFTDPNGFKGSGYYMGSLDGRTVYGNVICAGPVSDFPVPPKVPAADKNRHWLSPSDWMSEFFNTTSNPKGHGFNQSNADTGFACYTFEPKSNIPIKVIVLDDTQNASDPDDHGYGHGTLDKERYSWLVSELDKGQAEGKLMIIATHVPIAALSDDRGGLGEYMTRSKYAAVSEEDLIAKLHTYPNLILLLSGHRHINTVTAQRSPDSLHPELGFWEVETASLRDFPQQFRTFDIVRNSDNTISIFTTDVDPAVKDGSLAAQSRSYGIAAQQIFYPGMDITAIGSYNAELVKQLSPEMQAKIQNSGTPIGQNAMDG